MSHDMLMCAVSGVLYPFLCVPKRQIQCSPLPKVFTMRFPNAIQPATPEPIPPSTVRIMRLHPHSS